MDAMETTRPARNEDWPACAELLARALTDVRSVRGGAALVGHTTGEQLLSRWSGEGSPHATLHVGEFHHAVVGLAAATVAPRSPGPELSGRIECCYVEEAARGVGVGSALMESMVAWCEAQGCHDIDALALPGDRLSKQRLEAAGFTARLLILNRRVN
jgi:GNAT superfamily N-acetyltransferase